ncbi:PAS domain S-box-containing protein [Bacillus sp. V-88]|uniref:ATP-binding protein n=1 Tax=Rossellomorea vietnamensis TaxID=218284 RepID=UPI0009D32A4F|nr:ATP-binding protein [Rossellomorea vietnamensis]PRX76728.1 PAS domain S-box-containing protein [Bacillus sp. V-88]SLK21788.1 PAS domain S-box-containing protein [Bacillus sp. V-88]
MAEKVNGKEPTFHKLIIILMALSVLQVIGILILDSPWDVIASLLLMCAIVAVLLILLKRGNRFMMRHQKLLEEENQLSTLLHSLPDFVCFKDGDGRWLKVNQFGRRLYNLEDIDYVGKTDQDLGELVPFFKDAFDYCIDSDEESWKAEQVTRCEEGFFLPNGEFKTFDVIKVPLFHSNHERKGLVIIGRDISQQKIAEEMLLRKEKLSVVGELAAGIAHEIRNPLTSIKGFIQLLEENEHVSDHYLKVMSSEMDRINQIVGELLILSKPQMREFQSFDMSEVLRYVVKVMGHEALLKGITLNIKLPTSPILVFGDKNQCIQVFINIIKNAIESMDEGEIDVDWKIRNESIHIIIEDEGTGIPPDRLKRLGEPFFTLKEKGMGLGLTISQKIIEDHKGSLHIESEVNKGTKVEVTFPVV